MILHPDLASRCPVSCLLTEAPYVASNGAGALFILYSLSFEFNLSAFLIEVIWLLISIIGLIRIWRRRQNP